MTDQLARHGRARAARARCARWPGSGPASYATLGIWSSIDRLAPEYFDAHGPAEFLLAYRLAIIRRFLATARMGTLLEIGCGTGIHLLPLAGTFGQAHGIDVSPEMVRVACRHAEVSPRRARISLRVDAAEELATVEDRSVDVVLCVGALEHILDKPRAVRQVHRVLRIGGVFICLTPNGGYCWYSRRGSGSTPVTCRPIGS